MIGPRQASSDSLRRKSERKSKPVQLLPKECPRCKFKLLPATARFCLQCGSALTSNIIQQTRERAQLDVRSVLLGDQELLTSLAEEVAKVLKWGYAINEDKKDVDGVPGLEEL
jgi:predicted amidophosphoribosyltransferase